MAAPTPDEAGAVRLQGGPRRQMSKDSEWLLKAVPVERWLTNNWVTTVASLLYASPAWWGFTNAEQCNRLERLQLRLRRGGFLPVDSPSFEKLAQDADLGLFRSISSNPCHVHRHYFREREHTGHNLHPRAHNFALPIKDDRNFISRVLYGVLN